MTTFIYLLICPIDGRVKYVGKANNPLQRLRDHVRDFRCMDARKANWIRRLRAEGRRPEVLVLEEVAIADWKFWEEWWCQYWKGMGFELFNKRSRNGLTYANSRTFKPGHVPWNKGKKTTT